MPQFDIFFFSTACQCNNQAKECNHKTGRCHCTTKGIIGEKCDRCDIVNHYYGDPVKNSCYCKYTRHLNKSVLVGNFSEKQINDLYSVYVLLFGRVCINGCPTITNFQNVTLKVYFYIFYVNKHLNLSKNCFYLKKVI